MSNDLLKKYYLIETLSILFDPYASFNDLTNNPNLDVQYWPYLITFTLILCTRPVLECIDLSYPTNILENIVRFKFNFLGEYKFLKIYQ